MKAKTAALTIGAIFILIGLLGFTNNPIVGEADKAIFHADTMHNWVHIISGVLFVLVALAAPTSASIVLIIFGIVYTIIGIIGFVSIGSEGMGTVLGILHVNGADNFLHVA